MAQDEVWCDGEPSVEAYQLFRRIAIDFKYKLWINGKKLYDPEEDSCDTSPSEPSSSSTSTSSGSG